MTNHEYLKQQSAEWLADKLSEIMDCDCCPAANLCRRKQAKIEGEGGIKKLNQPSVVPGRPIGRKIFRFLRSFENERQWGAQKQQNYK